MRRRSSSDDNLFQTLQTIKTRVHLFSHPPKVRPRDSHPPPLSIELKPRLPESKPINVTPRPTALNRAHRWHAPSRPGHRPLSPPNSISHHSPRFFLCVLLRSVDAPIVLAPPDTFVPHDPIALLLLPPNEQPDGGTTDALIIAVGAIDKAASRF